MRLLIPTVCLGFLTVAGCEPGSPEPTLDEVARAGLTAAPTMLDFEALPPAPFASSEPFLEAAWGDDPGSCGQELVGARTGPMALAALPSGGLALLDTVNGRVHRYDAQGTLRSTRSVGVETGDDLVALHDGGLALLAYRRLPTPGHEVLSFDPEGALRSRRAVPQVASLPTALLAQGDQLYVEQRHGYAHPLDGSRRLWGRPVGRLVLRAELTEDRDLRLTARSRGQGQLAWQVEVQTPWPVTELLGLEVNDELIALILRHVDDSALGSELPALEESWLLAFDHQGRPLGRLALQDQRVTDAQRPFSLGPRGELFELVTTDLGVTVLRYRPAEGGAR